MGVALCRGHKDFQDRWSSSIQQAQAASIVSSTVVFDRVWSNKQRGPSRQNAVSIWRPIPAHGYIALGDCLVSGSWAAPKSVTVLQVDDTAEEHFVAPAKACCFNPSSLVPLHHLPCIACSHLTRKCGFALAPS